MKNVNYQALTERVIGEAKKRGATACDVTVSFSSGEEVSVCNGERENIEASDDQSMKLRIFVGNKTAVGNTKDFTVAGVRRVVAATVAEAKLLQEDPFAGLPAAEFAAKAVTAIPLVDPGLANLTPAKMLELALQTERAAYEFDPRVTKTESASCSRFTGMTFYASSEGVFRSHEAAHCSFGLGIVAQSAGEMQSGGYSSVSRRFADLDDPTTVGRKAAEEAVLKLGARKMKSGVYPVVFHPDMGAELLRSLVSAMAGPSIYMESSFLLGKLGESIACPELEIVDDALLPWGLGSSPFDDEGLARSTRTIVHGGVLQSYLLDAYSARKLKSVPNGGFKTTNLFIKPGSAAPTPAALLGSVKDGLYLTEIKGRGFNVVTGDYSVGAGGRRIVNGQLAEAIDNVTIAGHLLEMFSAAEMANDLVLRRSVSSPTLKFNMVVAGE